MIASRVKNITIASALSLCLLGSGTLTAAPTASAHPAPETSPGAATAQELQQASNSQPTPNPQTAYPDTQNPQASPFASGSKEPLSQEALQKASGEKSTPAYQFPTGNCVRIKAGDRGYLGSDKVGGVRVNAQASQAEPFRLSPAGLSRWSIRGPQGRWLFQSIFNTVMRGSTYGNEADWTVQKQASGQYVFLNTFTGSGIQVNSLGGLTLGGSAQSFTLEKSTGCYTPKNIDLGVVGSPSTLPADQGLVDGHTHITANIGFGGRFKCGAPFSPGGDETATASCSSHSGPAPGSIFNAAISGTGLSPIKAGGWPNFETWPRNNQMLFEQSYYKGLERAWRGGLRVINNYLVSNRVICSIYPLNDGQGCDEMTSINLQYKYLHEMQDYIDAVAGGPGKGFFRIAKTPEETRNISAQGKLAVTLGVEASELFGCSARGDTPRCSAEAVTKGLDDLKAKGISRVYLVHKFDNGFGGTRFDTGVQGTIINLGQFLSTGHWWQVEKCTGPSTDNPLALSNDNLAKALSLGFKVPAGTYFPVYPTAPSCNVRGLSTLGEFTVREIMKRGMIISVDHMSVKTVQKVLDIAEEKKYPGVISDHTWSDPQVLQRVIKLGGFVSGYAANATVDPPAPGKTPRDSEKSFPQFWKDTKAGPYGSLISGFGFSSDSNGLGVQPSAPPATSSSPVKYPITVNNTTFERSRWGNKTWDYNEVGVANYGLFVEWYFDVLSRSGTDAPTLEREMMNARNAFIGHWEKTQGSTTG